MSKYYIEAILDEDILDELASYPPSRVLILKVERLENSEEREEA